MRHRLLPVLTLALGTLTLGACSSNRYGTGSPFPTSSRYPGGVYNGDRVGTTEDGRPVYRDRDGRLIVVNRDGSRRVYNGRVYNDGRSRQTNNDRVTVCHNGRTQTVGASAVRAHLRHGDYVGACRTNRRNDDRRGDDRYDDRDDRRNEQGKDRRGNGNGRGRGND